MPETKTLFYDSKYDFNAKIQEIFLNLQDKNKKNIVILDQSAFYPTSGGQQHDVGTLKIEGVVYNVVNVEKVGKSTLHILDKELPEDKDFYVNKEVEGEVD